MKARLSDTWLDVGKSSSDDSTFVFSHNKVARARKAGWGSPIGKWLDMSCYGSEPILLYRGLLKTLNGLTLNGEAY